MKKTRSCPVCKSNSKDADIFMEENIDPALITNFSYASRKTPEWMNHLLLKCRQCSLVYAPEPPAVDELAIAYHQAAYDSSEEANDAALAYVNSIKHALERLPKKEFALEIGTGTGVFLDYLDGLGFKNIMGVEPSKAAIDAAPKGRQSKIKHGIFVEADYAPNSLDLICCFMTLEHVQDPMEITCAAYRLLRSGGAFICVTHDYLSPINKILGKKSPIIDIEHMQLFSKNSMKAMYGAAGFSEILISSFINRYLITYWLRLTPIPKVVKKILITTFHLPVLRKSKVGLNVGNIVTIGYK